MVKSDEYLKAFRFTTREEITDDLLKRFRNLINNFEVPVQENVKRYLLEDLKELEKEVKNGSGRVLQEDNK